MASVLAKSVFVLASIFLLATVLTLFFVFHHADKSSLPLSHEEEKIDNETQSGAPLIEFRHHNNSELNFLLQSYAKYYPHLARLYSIGRSVRNNDILVLEISDNPGAHEPGEPEIKLVGNIHGNEVVGREMLLYLVDYLLKNYKTNEAIRNLVDSVRIHIAPTINPDGYQDAQEEDCEGVVGRENANQVDLNRNFPEQFMSSNELHRYGLVQKPLQPETINVIKWTKSHPFVLSLALHGGALVVNFPFDNNKNLANRYTKSPDDQVFRHISLLYAKNHVDMSKGKCTDGCGNGNEEEYFENGIVNGASWYPITGGMQDWNYLEANCFEITIELGCNKYPPSQKLAEYWEKNIDPIIRLINAVHLGVRGFVTDQHGQPVEGAVVCVEGIAKNITTHRWGDYWRLLTPNSRYNVSVHKAGYVSQSQSVYIDENVYQLNFTLLYASS